MPTLLTITRSETRRMMSPDELWSVCRDAARAAVRPPYSADDRAECVADIFGDVVAMVADEAPLRHGRPADVLAYIGHVLGSETVRQSAAMPCRTDARVSFTALKNRALNWRRVRDAARDRDALMSGRDATTYHEPDDSLPLQYVAAGAAQNIERAHRAALAAVDALGMRGDYGAYLLMYQWARNVDARTAADELGMPSHGAYRAATARAATRIRDGRSIGRLMLDLCGAPLWRGDEYVFVLRDDSEEAHGHTSAMALDPRDGSASTRDQDGRAVNVWPERALTAAHARQSCQVSHQRPAPKTATRARTRALKGMSEDQAHAQALGRLGYALSRAHGRMAPSAVGRTSGKAPQRYAPHLVRLGTR